MRGKGINDRRRTITMLDTITDIALQAGAITWRSAPREVVTYGTAARLSADHIC
jgi:hypothetical protein